MTAGFVVKLLLNAGKGSLGHTADSFRTVSLCASAVSAFPGVMKESSRARRL